MEYKMNISLTHDPGMVLMPTAPLQFQLLPYSNLEFRLSTSSHSLQSNALKVTVDVTKGSVERI